MSRSQSDSRMRQGRREWRNERKAFFKAANEKVKELEQRNKSLNDVVEREREQADRWRDERENLYWAHRREVEEMQREIGELRVELARLRSEHAMCQLRSAASQTQLQSTEPKKDDDKKPKSRFGWLETD